MTQKMRVRVIGETEDGVKVKEGIVVDAYDRSKSKAEFVRLVAEQMEEIGDVAVGSSSDDRSPEVRRLYHLGVDRNSLIEMFGRSVYFAVFAELDADQRLRTMLNMLD